MRTTVTLDPDTEQLVRARMAATGTSFNRALNDAIRDGAAGAPVPRRFATRTASMGVPAVNTDNDNHGASRRWLSSEGAVPAHPTPRHTDVPT